ncbi:mitochondrial outer membrane translocase complex, subunit Tom5 [Aspergillus crustosus]
MFASGQEQITKEDLKAGEAQANQTVRLAVTGGVLLYLSPFAIDFVKKFL